MWSRVNVKYRNFRTSVRIFAIGKLTRRVALFEGDIKRSSFGMWLEGNVRVSFLRLLLVWLDVVIWEFSLNYLDGKELSPWLKSLMTQFCLYTVNKASLEVVVGK
ncbi:hypothetical protein AVEN_220546-1 [Araneus ventricosus]|uniref:Uncharacterized protein n=1 Tax=Araneus ventricosus TaxID=182803 RepID=A0A4Y2RMZ9_ARAVE|nr:hypothetical protein AVEN_220546-1 [Araneus ventricosus]